MTYLFNRTYAEQNGWTKDDAAERQLKALPWVLKVLGFIALEIVLEVCTSYFLDDFYGGWLEKAFRYPEKFRNVLFQIEYEQRAEIIRLDEVSVSSFKDGILTLKYKNRKRKIKKLVVADGYIGLKENIENGKFSKDTSYIDPFPSKVHIHETTLQRLRCI